MSGQVFDFQPNSTFPLKINGLLVTNSGSVAMASDPAGSSNTVFQFNGSNYLQYSMITPVVNTRCFWIYSASPSTGGGSVFSSSSYAIWFAGTSKLGYQVNYSAAAVNRTAINATQTGAWTHYAVVANGTTVAVYVNGVFDSSSNAVLSGTDSSSIQFGALSGANNFTGYMHSMRLYMRALNTLEINAVFNSTKLQADYVILQLFTHLMDMYSIIVYIIVC